MSFKNKMKNKRIVKFFPSKGKNLINPVSFFLNNKFSERLDSTFLKELNTKRMLKVAFGQGHSKMFQTSPKKSSNEFFLVNFLSKLECRVGNVLYNSGLAQSRYSVKQLISKRKIFVNGKKIKSQNYQVRKKDIIGFDPSVFLICKRQVLKAHPMFLQPKYFEVNYNLFMLVVLYEKLDRASIVFLSNKFSKLNFRFMNN